MFSRFLEHSAITGSYAHSGGSKEKRGGGDQEKASFRYQEKASFRYVRCW